MNPLSEEEFATNLQDAYARLWTVATAVLGDRDTAEDVVQEAAITAHRKLAEYQRGTNFVAWMSQIVRFTALNYRKRRQSRKEKPTEGHLVSEHASTPQPQSTGVGGDGQLEADQQAFDDEVASALQTLDAERRACLLLRVVHELSYDEIAELLEIPPGTAMSHVHRAKSTMRGALRPGVSSLAGGEVGDE